jgi:hypothetical protein
MVSIRGRRRGVGPIRERVLDVDAALWLYLGVESFLGLHALPVRIVELLRQLWLGLVAGLGRLPDLVGPGLLWWSRHRGWFWRLSSAVASRAAPPESSGRWWRAAGAAPDVGCQSESLRRNRGTPNAKQNCARHDCRAYSCAASSAIDAAAV